MQDSELRERFADWARPMQDVAPPPLSAIRSRARRRVAARAATGAGTLAVAGVVVGLVISALPGRAAGHPGLAGPGLLPGPGPSATVSKGTGQQDPPQSGRFPRGAPFLVTIGSGGSSSQAVVHDMATGAAASRVSTPNAGDDFTWVSASADDREFVLAAQSQDHQSTSFYTMRLDTAGHAAPLRRLSAADAVTGEIVGMGMSPDGSEFYVDAVTNQGIAGPAVMWVIPTDGSAQIRDWQTTTGTLGAISWEPDGTLAVAWEPGQANNFTMYIVSPADLVPGHTGLLPGQARRAPAGLAQAAKPPAQLTPDGSAVLVIVQSGASIALNRYATATGQLAESVPLAPLSDSGGSNYCGVLWSSPSGSSVLAQCGSGAAWVSGGHATSVKLAITVPATQVGWANTFAW